jgi:hypothetical protein
VDGACDEVAFVFGKLPAFTGDAWRPPAPVKALLDFIERVTGLAAALPSRFEVDAAGSGFKVITEDKPRVVEHTFRSLEEVPPELRSEVERLMRKAESSPDGTAEGSSALSAEIVRTTGVDGVSGSKSEVIRFRDWDGVERVYNSVDEMPPEIRAFYDRLRRQSP